MTVESLHPFVQSAVSIWTSGGWGMIALAVDGLVIFGLGMIIHFGLVARGLYVRPGRLWRTWKRNPRRVWGNMKNLATGAAACRTLDELAVYFNGIRHAELLPFQRDLKVMKVSVTAAPLLGLLGTVTGMLMTFKALASGGGGEKTMGMIASGISEALITTETGLVLALTGMMFQFVLNWQHDRYDSVVNQLEILFAEDLRRTVRPAADEAGAPCPEPVAPAPPPEPAPAEPAPIIAAAAEVRRDDGPAQHAPSPEKTVVEQPEEGLADVAAAPAPATPADASAERSPPAGPPDETTEAQPGGMPGRGDAT